MEELVNLDNGVLVIENGEAYTSKLNSNGSVLFLDSNNKPIINFTGLQENDGKLSKSDEEQIKEVLYRTYLNGKVSFEIVEKISRNNFLYDLKNARKSEKMLGRLISNFDPIPNLSIFIAFEELEKNIKDDGNFDLLCTVLDANTCFGSQYPVFMDPEYVENNVRMLGYYDYLANGYDIQIKEETNLENLSKAILSLEKRAKEAIEEHYFDSDVDVNLGFSEDFGFTSKYVTVSNIKELEEVICRFMRK